VVTIGDGRCLDEVRPLVEAPAMAEQTVKGVRLFVRILLTDWVAFGATLAAGALWRKPWDPLMLVRFCLPFSVLHGVAITWIFRTEFARFRWSPRR